MSSQADRAGTGGATALAVAFGAGVLGAVQPKVNAVLGARVDSSLVASLVNFAVAWSVVLVALALRPSTRRTLRAIRTWPVPRWTLLAGAGGVAAVLAGAAAVETIGVAIFSVAFFAGQITASVLVDRLGVGPGGPRALGANRVVAAAVALGAVAVSQVGRPAGEFAPLLVMMTIGAGATVAFQAAFNGRITVAVRDPVAATAVNVTVGLTLLTLSVAAAAVGGALPSAAWPREPWLYAGGLLGVTIVFSLAVATAVVRVLQATLAMLAAQLITAFGVDWIVADDPPTAGRIAGAALIVVAVILVRRDSPT